ncbi:hypothetical protein FACS189487_04410 [Campylobacterota bacterium]|nr:hypothetical protein FACS189487_04410 [Campylobacterota bacterium]
MTIALSGASALDFILSADAIGSIDVGVTDTFTLVPSGGLGLGTYEATVTVSGDNEISASFDLSFVVAPDFTVTFVGNGASTESTPSGISSIIGGSTIDAALAPDPAWNAAPTANVFLGWYSGDTKWVFGASGTPVTTNTTLTAKWKFTADEVALNTIDFPSVAASAITVKPVNSLSEFVAAKSEIMATAGNYVLNITSTITIGDGESAIMPAVGTVVSLRGGGTIYRASSITNYLFYIANSGSKLILRNATLKGYSGNNGALVYVSSGTEFVMIGGEIRDNTSTAVNGGGVFVGGGSFTMSGGEIGGNTAKNGGGVYVDSGATFSKNGGIIYGSSGDANANTATASSGGNAVYYYNSGSAKYRSTTLGVNDDISTASNDNWGI